MRESKQLGPMTLLPGRLRQIFRYKPATHVGRLAYGLARLSILLLVLGRIFHGFRAASIGLVVVISLVLAPLLFILLLRTVNRRLLWKVRNRLILTYVFMGLAPVVLFGTITGIAAYIFAGQYATNTALSSLEETQRRVASQATAVAIYANSHPDRAKWANEIDSTYGPEQADMSFAFLDNEKWHAMPRAAGKDGASPFADQPQVSWLGRHLDGAVMIDDHLYLCSLAVVANGSHTTSVLASMPIKQSTLNSVAHGIGKILILPGFSIDRGEVKAADDAELPALPPLPPPAPKGSKAVPPVAQEDASVEGIADKAAISAPGHDSSERFHTAAGGVVPAAKHLLDLRVFFSAPVPVTAWQTGKRLPALIAVISRPTALYDRLFATAASTGTFVRVALLSIAYAFGLLELFSLLMAMQLSRSITKSVAELYKGTTEIDRGNLVHRIHVKRQDQLGALATSFNAMAASIQNLLVQQREKERLLAELTIAQEVQRNLFPASPARITGMEVHALCIPARTVSGDYFDYIFGDNSQLCLTLGDISGKGISAALLMASLHSAVRSFTLGSGNGSSNMRSPAHLLSCLNRHLYHSTQMEKYATLFLAFYDVGTGTLTYSNGGHLPPLILSPDGTVRRLETGGPVVGLLDHLSYEEATVQLRSGDLLVAYTDGLTEPENATGEFGEDRLRSFVQSNGAKELDVLALDTMGEVKQWIGIAEQPDDMTILFARKT